MSGIEARDISVIVCAYNAEKTINKCLESLSGQKGVDPGKYEVIVIDDGSQDRTADLVKVFLEEYDHQAVFRYVKIQHGGLSVARNTGILLAKAPLVAYIDSDAIAEEFWVRELLKAWNSNPDADAIGGHIRILNPENHFAQLLHDSFYDESDKRAIIGANMSFRRSKLMDVGGFCDLFASRGDETYIFRKIGDKLIKWPKAIVYHERPEKLARWLRERKENGQMIVLVETICGPKVSWLKKTTLKHLTKALLGTIFLFAMALKWPIMVFIMIPSLLIYWKQLEVWGNMFRLCREKSQGFIKTLYVTYLAVITSILGDFVFYCSTAIAYLNSFSRRSDMLANRKCTLSRECIIEEICANTEI